MGNLSQYHTGYKTAAHLINYFDKYNIFAGKYVDYIKFRKVYIMITEGKHLEEKGIKKIKIFPEGIGNSLVACAHKHSIDTITKLKEKLSKENHPKFGSFN
uniref:Homing endonuclease LAGLIDADG domain-containing protein n=1 Tax=Gibberella zeae TaxID=5518 RepID=A0A4E9EKR3_GIBZA